MVYLQTILRYLSHNFECIAVFIAAIMVTVLMANIFISPYLCHNIAVKQSIRALKNTARTGKLAPFVDSIPPQYKAQWKCYTTAGNTDAREMFSAPLRRKTFYLWRLFAIGSAMIAVCIALFVYNNNSTALLVSAIYAVAVAPLLLLCYAIKYGHYKHSLRCSVDYVGLISAYFGKGNIPEVTQASQQDIVGTIRQIELLSANTDGCLQRVSELLASQPINAERTTKQQQAINRALNKLLLSPNK